MTHSTKRSRFHHASWADKFLRSARGCWVAVNDRNGGRFSSWWVHLAAVIAAIACGISLQISLFEWCLIAFAIGIVVVSELFNTSIEHLARSITSTHDTNIRNALDVAAGAVLCASVVALLVGTIVFTRHFL